MRSILLCLAFVSSAHAAGLVGIPVQLNGNPPDTLMASSFVCAEPETIVTLKEQVLTTYNSGADLTDLQDRLRKGDCDVTNEDQPAIVVRMVRGWFKGLDGERSNEILLELEHEGRVIGWTESVNLLESAKLYEQAKARMNATN